jgi:hypothetical protein
MNSKKRFFNTTTGLRGAEKDTAGLIDLIHIKVEACLSVGVPLSSWPSLLREHRLIRLPSVSNVSLCHYRDVYAAKHYKDQVAAEMKMFLQSAINDKRTVAVVKAEAAPVIEKVLA